MAQAYWCTALTGPAIGQKPSCRRLGTPRTGNRVAEELPGCIPRVLRLDDISLRRADETVFNSIDLNTEGGHVRLGMELLTVFTTATLLS